MKILCVCQEGNKRSVFTKALLNYNHDAIAVGTNTNSEDTIAMLCEWADAILLAEPDLFDNLKLPPGTLEKIDQRFIIGPDNFPVVITGNLRTIIERQLKELEYRK